MKIPRRYRGDHYDDYGDDGCDVHRVDYDAYYPLSITHWRLPIADCPLTIALFPIVIQHIPFNCCNDGFLINALPIICHNLQPASGRGWPSWPILLPLVTGWCSHFAGFLCLLANITEGVFHYMLRWRLLFCKCTTILNTPCVHCSVQLVCAGY